MSPKLKLQKVLISLLNGVPDFLSQAEEDFLTNFSGTNFFSVGIFIAVFVLPSILLSFIYGRIYMEAHKNLVRIRLVFLLDYLIIHLELSCSSCVMWGTAAREGVIIECPLN